MTTPTRIAATFSALKAQGHMAFMPFVTVGDPDVETSIALIRELSNRGVDLIEVGFPYSDPIADGPVIQSSYTRALAAGFTLEKLFALAKAATARVRMPILAMAVAAAAAASCATPCLVAPERAAAAGTSAIT